MATCFRSPRTHNENRQNSDPEYSDLVRSKRKNIVTAWDDVHRSDIGNRSWKRHRTTQWKGR